MVFNVTIYDSCKDANNVVYTEGGLHRPAPGTALTSGNAVITATDVHPRQSEKYSRMVLPAYWYPSKLRQPVFVVAEEKMRVETGNPQMPYSVTTVTAYGWVDSVRMATESSLEQYSNTATAGENIGSVEITWHVDWWLTAGANASYKAGRLKRGPSTYARPDPSTPRKWIYDSSTTITADNKTYAVVQYVKNTYNGDDLTKTEIKTRFWPVGESITIPGGASYDSISLEQIYSGELEEMLGLDPDTILGVWISPIPPYDTTGQTRTTVTSPSNLWWYEADVVTPKVTTITVTGSTTDSAKYIVTDPTGAVMGTVPWGLGFTKILATVDVGPSGAVLMMNFVDGNSTGYGEGRIMALPLISAPVTSNASSSYVLSGQRAYDMETKRIQNEQGLVNGIAGAGSSAIGGAIAGGNAGPAGAAAGAGAGLVSAIVGSAVGYFSAQVYDKQTQRAVDTLMSNQANNVVVSSGGLAWNTNALDQKWHLVKMTRDSVSLAELSAEQSELGYITDTQVADCTSLISGKGGLRIEGLEVYGVAPEGARYISQMFARGVHLD